jgi:hypothetical protein
MAIIVNPVLPNILTNGTEADATQVMADFAAIISQINTNAAENGANSSITSLLGLTTPLSTAQGGTGLSTPAQYSVLLGGAAASPMTVATPSVAGQVLTDNGPSAAPSFAPVVVSKAEIVAGLGFLPVSNTSPSGNNVQLAYVASAGTAIFVEVDTTAFGYVTLSSTPASSGYNLGASLNAVNGLFDNSNRVWSTGNFQPNVLSALGSQQVFNVFSQAAGTFFTGPSVGGTWLSLGVWTDHNDSGTTLGIRVS